MFGWIPGGQGNFFVPWAGPHACQQVLQKKHLHPEEGCKVHLCSHSLTGFMLQAPSLLHLDASLLTFTLDLYFGEAKENTDFNNKKKA